VTLLSRVWALNQPACHKLVLIALADYAGPDGTVELRHADIVEMTRVSDGAVTVALRALMRAGEIEPDPTNRPGVVRRYRLRAKT